MCVLLLSAGQATGRARSSVPTGHEKGAHHRTLPEQDVGLDAVIHTLVHHGRAPRHHARCFQATFSLMR